MPNTQMPIAIKNLSFSYKTQTLFKNYDLEISGNQFAGIIGANGSGKSTFLKLLLGLLSPQQGAISVLNNTVGSFANKYLVGSSLQEIDFPQSEKVEEIITFICKQYPNPMNTEELIEKFDLQTFRKKPCGQLSGGMKRRVALACAFAGTPQVILLDEPTTGLDQSSRKKIIQNIKSYQEKHKSLVLMISHHPHELSNTIDQFFHLKKGQIQELSTQKMQELSQLRRIDFKSSKDIQFDKEVKLSQSDQSYSLITNDADSAVKQLCSQDDSFKNLMIRKLDTEELMQDIL